jgi:transformation/transcription domain-associated protein
MQEIYEEHCHSKKIYRDQPLIYFVQKMKEAFKDEDMSKKTKVEVLNLKTEIMEEIAFKFIPDTILCDFMTKSMATATDYWMFRKRFIRQLASATFLTYLFSVGHRQPHRLHVSRRTGNMWTSEIVPTISSNTCLYTNQEAVPFRFTPNLQTFLTPVGIEGPFNGALAALAKSLAEPEVPSIITTTKEVILTPYLKIDVH